MAEIRKVVLGDVDVGALQMEVESLWEQLEAKAERLTTTQELYLAEQARAEAAEAKLAEVEKLEVGFYQERGRAEHAEAKLAEVGKERDRLQEQLNAALDVGDRATDQRDRLRASTDRARELAEARLQGREFLSDKQARTFEEIARLLSGDE